MRSNRAGRAKYFRDLRKYNCKSLFFSPHDSPHRPAKSVFGGNFLARIAAAPLTKHAADALDGQTIPVSIITLEDLEAAPWTGRNFPYLIDTLTNFI
ncbi:hypothetical protein FYJ44_13595 [Desulfovibrio sp. PG-178-WT-4]|uniref:Uncharacterized protein n=1 Tax=Desulfovibrio porci TaxID=2605782 RepID=A0A6L5XPH3_9BACT|nr:hypothetical protein [Desulfovibrio porci]MDY3808904.1 hypothetical protein [Desulfovibrio porci]MSS29032.1 hypothetical protein [Desulfovibrio porci]